MSDEQRARECLAQHLRPINKGASWNVLEGKDDAYWLPILQAMAAYGEQIRASYEDTPDGVEMMHTGVHGPEAHRLAFASQGMPGSSREAILDVLNHHSCDGAESAADAILSLVSPVETGNFVRVPREALERIRDRAFNCSAHQHGMAAASVAEKLLADADNGTSATPPAQGASK